MTEVHNAVIDRCDSTNEYLRHLGEKGFPHGTWISARSQNKGRGRLGREWVSVEGNLFLSILVRLDQFLHTTWIPLLAAVVVVRAIRSIIPAADLKIKWPNDVWLSGAKLGGILCEGVGNSRGSFLVAGIGINCVPFPEGTRPDQPAATLAIPVDDLRCRVLNGFLSAIAHLSAYGPAEIIAGYEQCALLTPGSRIIWTEMGLEQTAEVVGLGPSGELRVLNDQGIVRALWAEDVRVRPQTGS